MKRIILTITVLLALTTYAQEPLNTVVRNLDNIAYYHGCLQGVGNCNYLIFKDVGVSSFLNTSKEVVVEVPNNGNNCNVLSIERGSGYKLLMTYQGEHNVYMLYRHYNAYTQEFSLHLNAIPKEAGIDKWEPEKLLSFKSAWSDGFQMATALSPDQSKAVLLLLQVKTAGMFEKDKTDKLKGSALLFFEEGRIVDSKPLEFDIENNTLNFLNISLDNDGTAFLAFSSFNRDSEQANESVHVYSISSEEMNSCNSEIEFGHISNGKFLVTKSGQIVLGGYYSADHTKPEEGSYLMTFSPSLTNMNTSHEKFPDEYFTYKHPKASRTVQNFRAEPVGLFEFDNGIITLMGEMRSFQYTLVSLIRLAGPTLISRADKEGNLLDFQTYTKHQISNWSDVPSQMFSYYAFMKDNLIHLIYSDNLENVTQNTELPLVIKDTKPNGRCAAHRTLDSEGQLSTAEVLMDYEKYKCIMFVPFGIEDDGLWIFHTSGNSNAVSRLPFQF